MFGIIDQDSDITIEYPLGGIDRNGPQGSMRIFGDQFGNFVDDITVLFACQIQDGLIRSGSIVGPAGLDDPVRITANQLQGIFTLAAVYFNPFRRWIRNR